MRRRRITDVFQEALSREGEERAESWMVPALVTPISAKQVNSLNAPGPCPDHARKCPNQNTTTEPRFYPAVAALGSSSDRHSPTSGLKETNSFRRQEVYDGNK